MRAMVRVSSGARAGADGALRWGLPGVLFLGELLALSLAVDLPTAGPAMRLVSAVRMVIPVVVGAAAGAWLLRGPALQSSIDDGAALPPWRPWPALALQPLAFAASAAVGWHLLREGAPPPGAGAIAAWLATLAVAGLLALWIAAPIGWTARVLLRRWRVPILAIGIGLLVWRAAAAAEGLWGVLSAATLDTVAAILQALSGDVTVDPSARIIGLRGFSVSVAPVCSGVDGVGLMLIFQATWLSLARARLRFPRALLLLPLGAAAALVANVLRISLLLLVGASGHQVLALGAFHSKLGWLLFIALALGSVALAERTAWLRRPERDGEATRDDLPDDAAAHLAPLVAAIGAGVITAAFGEGPIDVWYGVRIGAAAAVLWLVRTALPRPALSASWSSVLLGLAVGGLWLVAGHADGEPLRAALAALPPAERVTWIGLRIVGACVVIPIVEELAFRGFLLPWLSGGRLHAERAPARSWSWAAVLVSSVAFGAVHERWILGTIAGLAFAAARLRRDRLGDAVLAHAISNAVLAAAVLALGRWDLWS